MKEYMRYKADTTPPRSRTQNISLCFLISISAVILKLILKITSISPCDLGESLRRRRRRRRRSAFIYHTFIHTHKLLHYYKVGDQASVEVEGVEEQMLISSSLTPGRVKGSWIVLVLNLVGPLSSNRAVAHDARSQRGIWCHWTSASACFFGNDRSSRS